MIYQTHNNPGVATLPPSGPIAVKSATALVGGQATAASEFAWTTDAATTQAAFAAAFLGISTSDRTADDIEYGGAGTVNVETSTTRTIECESDTFEVGDLVAMAADAVNEKLLDSKVVKTANAGESVGKVMQQYATATTQVRVQFTAKAI